MTKKPSHLDYPSLVHSHSLGANCRKILILFCLVYGVNACTLQWWMGTRKANIIQQESLKSDSDSEFFWFFLPRFQGRKCCFPRFRLFGFGRKTAQPECIRITYHTHIFNTRQDAWWLFNYSFSHHPCLVLVINRTKKDRNGFMEKFSRLKLDQNWQALL